MFVYIDFVLSLVFSVKFAVFLLASVGVYAICWWLIDNLSSVVQVVRTLLQPYFQPQEDLSLVDRYGNWAVITGSTDGIGKQYAREFASKGINIVLISRSQSKLVQVANEIEKDYPVKTKWITADFSEGEKTYKHIEQELAGIPVGILVNNVGRMYDFPDELGKISQELLWNLINVNIGAVTMMTRILVNGMKTRGKGAIVNISSGSELQPMPYMAVYAASKVYVKNFTLAIQHEFASYGITVQLVTPMYVKTKMNNYSSSVMTSGNILIPDVQTYTKSAVFSLGKTSETTGFWTHGIQYGAMRLIPTWLRTIIGKKMNEQFREEYYQMNGGDPSVLSQ